MDNQTPIQPAEDRLPLLKKKMTRKQFLGTVASGALSVIGITRIIGDVNDHMRTPTAGTYGAGTYGGGSVDTKQQTNGSSVSG